MSTNCVWGHDTGMRTPTANIRYVTVHRSAPWLDSSHPSIPPPTRIPFPSPHRHSFLTLRACENNPSCSHFTMDPHSGICYMKSGKGTVVTGFPDVKHLISGDVIR